MLSLARNKRQTKLHDGSSSWSRWLEVDFSARNYIFFHYVGKHLITWIETRRLLRIKAETPAVVEFAAYKIQRLNFKCVLHGHQLRSEPIRSNHVSDGFGNCPVRIITFVSVKEWTKWLDSERKIRSMSLLKYSRFSPSEVHLLPSMSSQVDELDRVRRSLRSFQDVTADLIAECWRTVLRYHSVCMQY